MLSSSLTTVQTDILDHSFIPENIRQLVFRRTENGKTFGKLEIIASPPDLVAGTDKNPPRNIVTGFLLDTSGSMEGEKLNQAVNTIKQFAQIFLAERNGKTLIHQPIHAWIYVISFNSTASVIIPFQEITEETLPGIFSQLDDIRVQGSTNYEAAFRKQTEVLGKIIEVLSTTDDLALAPTRRQFHFIRFFETDGEITQGTTNSSHLYKMMRQTVTATAITDATDATDATATDAALNITYEDYIIGYGKDVDLKCLKQLASPTPPPPPTTGGGARAAETADDEYNCSSLITVVRPEDIGWQIGEILFKLIMRFGVNMKVSVASADPAAGVAELFEYQTQQWSDQTTFHSIIHNERKPLYIQFTPAATASASASAPQPEIIVKVQCENQFTSSRYTYEFSHQSSSSSSKTMTLAETGLAASEHDDDLAKQNIFPIIQGMIQIEIFKQLRELEGNSNYDKDIIVREAYKTMRMLRAIDQQTTAASFPYSSIAPKTANLMTDVKIIIGLTAVNDPNQQQCIIHARRTASAQEDIFNTGADVSRKYVENEEDYEDIAREVIQARDGTQQPQLLAATATATATGEEYDDDDDDAAADDSLPSRIPTCMTPSRSSSSSSNHHRLHHRTQKPSILRLLCARIALSKIKNQDRSPESIYSEMKQESIHYGGHYDEDPSYHYTSSTQDDTFSTPSQDDEYTQRRMGMMRQMSSPLSS